MIHPKRARRNFSLSLSLSSPSSSKQAGPSHGKKGGFSRDYDAGLVPSTPPASAPKRTRPTSGSVSSHSSQTPLLAIPTRSAPSDPAVPPTTNELAPAEKMKLLHKVRKLSRVLGEVPVTVDEFLSESDTHFDSIPEDLDSFKPIPLPSPTLRGFSSVQSLKRSATLGHLSTFDASSGKAHNPSVHRIRSMASMRPSLTIPNTTPHRHSPVSPIVFAWPDGSQSETSSALYSDSRAPSSVNISIAVDPPPFDAPGFVHESPAQPIKSRRSSTASSVLVPEQNPELLQRTRAAKLARQLGDSVPPDVLLRAVSPAPRSLSPSPLVLPLPRPPSPIVSQVLNSSTLPRRTTSLRRGRPSRRADAKRRLSLDLRAFADMVVPAPLKSPASPAMKAEFGRQGRATLKKRRSAWLAAAVVHEEAEPNVEANEFENSFELGLGETMTDKERALALKRTRKMMQLFGDTPPATLYKITNSQATVSADDIASVVISITSRRRDSRATFVTLSDSMSVIHTHVRNSTISTASDPSAPVGNEQDPNTAPTSDETPAPPPEPPATEVEQESPPRSVPPPMNPRASVQSLASTASDPLSQSAHSHTYLLTSRAREFKQRPPITPPPFSDLFVLPPQPPADAAPDERPLSPSHELSPDFRTRRLRAAKLSRFFGVAPKDLAEVLPGLPGYASTGDHTTPPHTPAHASEFDFAAAMLPPPMPELAYPEAAHAWKRQTTVEVAAEMAGKSPFRIGRPGHVVREMDMRDVIEELRKMK